jgi:exodeoxyribonuclease VII large subunit
MRAGIQQRRGRLDDVTMRLAPALARAVAARRDRFDTRARGFRPAALIQESRRRGEALAVLSRRLAETGQRQVQELARKLEALDRLRETLSYKATLARGYAVVRSEGAVITTSTAARQATALEIEFADGRVTVGRKPAARREGEPPPEQGSLF